MDKTPSRPYALATGLVIERSISESIGSRLPSCHNFVKKSINGWNGSFSGILDIGTSGPASNGVWTTCDFAGISNQPSREIGLIVVDGSSSSISCMMGPAEPSSSTKRRSPEVEEMSLPPSEGLISGELCKLGDLELSCCAL